MSKFLQRTQPIETPRSALGFYRRRPDLRPEFCFSPPRVQYSKELRKRIVQVYRELYEGEGDKHYAGFTHTHKVMHQWRKALRKPVAPARSGRSAKIARYTLKGNCASFAECIVDRLIKAGIPRNCIHFLRCQIKGHPTGRSGHLVVRVSTTRGDLIICNITGVSSIGQPNLKNHIWHSGEDCGGWYSYREGPSLADVINGK